MDEKTSNFPGARFYKADLHIHTPASKCWEDGRDERNLEKIFKKLKENNIEVIAITDHNTVANIDKAIKLGKKYEIIVFPGVEVSTKEGHVIAIFDPSKNSKEIRDWLIMIGLPGDGIGDGDIVAKEQEGQQLSITRVFYLIEQAGGIAVAAHPNSKKSGFLGILKAKGSARQEAYLSQYLRGLELGKNKTDILKIASGAVPGYKKKYGCIACSDAHKVEDLGKTYTYIKLGDFGIEALRQVFYDPAMRIRLKGEKPPKEHIWIKSIEVNKGFFNGLKFKFHPDMNSIVGGKAVGKSLIIELLRFALGVGSPIPEINDNSEDMIKAKTCLGIGGTVILTVIGKDGQLYRIQRTYNDLDEGPEIYYGNTPTKAGDNINEFFQSQIYSQNEIIELGKNLPALLDWLDSFIDLEGEWKEIKEKKRKIKKALKQLDAKHEIAVKVPSLAKRKKELEEKKQLLEKRIKEPILESFPKWQSEERQLKGIQTGLKNIEEDLIEDLRRFKIEGYLPKTQKGTPNYDEINKLRNSILKLQEKIGQVVKILKDEIKNKNQKITTFVQKWRGKFTAVEKEYTSIIESAGVKNAAAITSELNKVTQAIEITEKDLEKSRDALKEKNILENTIRKTLIPEFSKAFKNIFEKRAAKATQISNSLNSFVSIRVFPMADRIDFEKRIEKLLKGSNIRKEKLRIIASKVTPIELAENILDRNVRGLSGKTNLKIETIKQFIETAWAKTKQEDSVEAPSKIYEIMLTQLKDTVTVELEVDPGVYKPMNELSGGSKCTAILSVALIEGTCPLIVDQPEDALDNPFVFERIVQTVRKTKTGRQYIFATHNSNVAVASDADLIYCLKASAHKGNVDQHGSIDEISTRDKVVANLEGGRKAFRLRTQKYDISVEDPNAVVLDIN